MTVFLAAVASALWLGILTSISPCPLASNVAAVSFIGRNVGSTRRVLAAGLIYTIGRALTYVLVAVLVVTSVLSIPGLSFFLQQRMNQVLGPLLILIGVAILGWVKLPLPSRGWGDKLQQRAAEGGLLGAGVLGMVFALSFCPVSAGLFFGGLIPLALSAHSHIAIPAIYGIGTGLPVLLLAVLLAIGAQGVGRAFHVLTRIEQAARPATGVIFILAGLYLSATHLFGLSL